MKLDPGIHIGMHLVCFYKTRCDTPGPHECPQHILRNVNQAFAFLIKPWGMSFFCKKGKDFFKKRTVVSNLFS
jgi:hypothetical protein